MYCEHCGKKSDGSTKFCINCGKPLVAEKKEVPKETPKQTPSETYHLKKPSPVPKIIVVAVVAGLIIWGVVSSSRNDAAIQSAKDALTTANSSDTAESTAQVIQDYKDAYNKSNDDADKLTILTNLAITYDSSGDTTDALATYQQALGYASQGTSDYYLISAEIAEDQNQPGTAQSDLNQANQLNPNDYQITNELALFYLDIDNSWVSYDDLPKALQYAKAAYALENNNTTTGNLALAYLFNDDYQQSIALLLPMDLTAHPAMALYLGEAYLGENDDKDARFYFQKAIDLGVSVPQDVTNYMNQ